MRRDHDYSRDNGEEGLHLLLLLLLLMIIIMMILAGGGSKEKYYDYVPGSRGGGKITGELPLIPVQYQTSQLEVLLPSA